MSILINLLLAIWMLVALLMILVILMQRPKSEGLGAAFGGAVTENIFGAQTTNVLTKFTSWLAGIFFVLTFVLSILYARRGMGDTALRRELLRTQSGSPVSQSAATTQPSPASPAPPDSGAGVLPAGKTTPLSALPATSTAPGGNVPPATAPAAPKVAPSATAPGVPIAPTKPTPKP